jgi:hypothetical protein
MGPRKSPSRFASPRFGKPPLSHLTLKPSAVRAHQVKLEVAASVAAVVDNIVKGLTDPSRRRLSNPDAQIGYRIAFRSLMLGVEGVEAVLGRDARWQIEAAQDEHTEMSAASSQTHDGRILIRPPF